MKPQYFIAILFVAAAYWMFLLYQPFLMNIIIAALLAMSTSNIQRKLEYFTHSALFSAIVSSILLAVLIFAPLGYFLTTFTLWLNTLDPEIIEKIYITIRGWIADVPPILESFKPYLNDAIEQVQISSIAAKALVIATTVGSYSAKFVKSAMLIIIFYFFAQYHGKTIFRFIKKVIQLPSQDTTLLGFELSSVMNVVFYSIITTAVLEGALFGIAVSFMGYNGLFFGIMYGFVSLLPVVGGVLMWLPFIIYEVTLGHTGNAIFIALYSIIVISIVADTFVKPLIIKEIHMRLIKSQTKINELLIFFAIIAGLTTFGFWGMILGPAITAFFMALLKLIEQRKDLYDQKSRI
ncbi:MAG: AI-2E family transporter [Epsilonproteobacteria bacterium]|nr:MAG: AI-2E family transporter [Campylobacterota bacterium]